MRLVDNEEDDLDILFNKLSKKIILDVKQLELYIKVTLTIICKVY